MSDMQATRISSIKEDEIVGRCSPFGRIVEDGVRVATVKQMFHPTGMTIWWWSLPPDHLLGTYLHRYLGGSYESNRLGEDRYNAYDPESLCYSSLLLSSSLLVAHLYYPF